MAISSDGGVEEPETSVSKPDDSGSSRHGKTIEGPDGKTTESVLSDDEAVSVCGVPGGRHAALVLWQTAQMLLLHPTDTTDGGMTLSAAQIFDAHRFAMEAVSAKGLEAALAAAPSSPYPFPLKEDVGPVFELLRPAVSEALAPPHLRIPDDEATLVLALAAGEAGQSETIRLYDEEAGASKPPVAVIGPDGIFTPLPGSKVRMAVVQAFRRFARAPAATAAHYGRLSGTCCYCGRSLSHPQSVAAGYGPECAARYGLPW